MAWLSGETYQGDGGCITITNGSGNAYTPGQPLTLGTSYLPCVCMEDIANGATGKARTYGVFKLSVTGVDGSGNSAVAWGDKLYLDLGVVNKDVTNGKFFGIALGAVNSGATATIDVMVGRGDTN